MLIKSYFFIFMPTIKSTYDAVVIGGGISGLMSALALSHHGQKVLLLEKSAEVGGNCRTYVKNGFRLDTGVHAITDIKSGATRTFLDQYFTKQPQFVPIGQYLARDGNKLQDIPFTIPALTSFSILPRRDRALMIGAMAIMINSSRASKHKQLDQSVANFIAPYPFSSQAFRFIDTLAYFLSGKSMHKTPLWRMLGGSGFLQENTGFKQNRPTRDKIKKLFLNNHENQGYPLGGIQTITDCVLASMQQNSVEIRTQEKALRIQKTAQGFSVQTASRTFNAPLVIYGAPMRELPELATDLPQDLKRQMKKLPYVISLTLWLGLQKPHPAFTYTGSEIFFNTETPYWASPVSNFDPALAPPGKQLIGFSTVVKNPSFSWTQKDRQVEIEQLRGTIQTAVPNFFQEVEMEEAQFYIPEKAAVSTEVTFPSPRSPLDGLYLVGTDTDMRSMGVTRATYSVLEMLKFAQADGYIKKA